MNERDWTTLRRGRRTLLAPRAAQVQAGEERRDGKYPLRAVRRRAPGGGLGDVVHPSVEASQADEGFLRRRRQGVDGCLSAHTTTFNTFTRLELGFVSSFTTR